MSTRKYLFHIVAVAAFCCWSCPDSIAQDAASSKEVAKIVFLVGPCSHSAGSHEAGAGARLAKYCIDQAIETNQIGQMQTEIFYRWPKDDSCLDMAATLVFTGDVFPGERYKQRERAMAKIGELMGQGCGIVCFHYATGLQARDVAQDGSHPLLDWMGGYHSAGCPHHRSQIAIRRSITYVAGDASHPVCRGWELFTVPEEAYLNSYFGPVGSEGRVVPIAYVDVPPKTQGKEIVIWAFNRNDGGRAVAFTPPHWFINWRDEGLRKAALNSIVWTAKLEVPEGGVHSDLPNLTEFKPDSVEPIKPPKWWKNRP